MRDVTDLPEALYFPNLFPYMVQSKQRPETEKRKGEKRRMKKILTIGYYGNGKSTNRYHILTTPTSVSIRLLTTAR